MTRGTELIARTGPMRPAGASWAHPKERDLWQVRQCAVCMGVFWAAQARLVTIEEASR